MSVLTPLGVFAKNARSLYIGTRNKVFNPNRWCLSVFLDPRLSGCMNHTVDPKLKQGDLICRATSGLRSCKVASFISVACDHVNLKTDTLPRHTCKSFSADSWRPGNIVLSDVIDTHTHTAHGHPCSSEGLLFFCASVYGCAPHNLKYCPWYVSGTCVIFTSIVTSNLSNISVSSHTSSSHEVTILIEACLELLLFEQ